MKELKESGVEFYEHGKDYEGGWYRYFLDGVPLMGITGLIRKHLFPDMYKGIDQDILNKSAERGTYIHNLCGLYDELGITPPEPQALPYVDMVNEYDLKHERTEYIVTDKKHYASGIDKVYRVDNKTFDLADIKTTSKLHNEYLSWQLSIYAYLFEKQNPGTKVRNLYAIWLPNPEKNYGKAHLETIGRIPNKVIKELLDCDVQGKKFVNPYAKVVESESTLPAKYSHLEQQARELEEKANLYKRQYEELKAELLKAMQENGAYSWKSDTMYITRKESYERISYDMNKLLEEHPEIDKQRYAKVSKVSESITLKFK